MAKGKSFSPWKANRFRGIVVSAISMWVAYLAVTHVISMVVGLAVGGLGLLYGMRQLTVANNREFGKKLEEHFTAAAAKTLQDAGFNVQANRMTRHIGDIDMVVSKGKKKVTVEIKSFIVWNRVFFFFNGDRERKAVSQAFRQKQAIEADLAIIWLPQGRTSFWSFLFPTPSVGKGVRLVRGGTRSLKSALKSLL